MALVPRVPAQAPGKLKSESGDHRPVGVGPPLGLWLPMGSEGAGEHAGPLVSNPPPAHSSTVAVGGPLTLLP